MAKLQKFVLVGQPRTGTTNLVKILSGATTAYCANELFNPKAIIFPETEKNITDETSLMLRDIFPKAFISNFYGNPIYEDKEALGFNYMLCHAKEVLNEIIDDDDIKILYIRRENKLAQFASWSKAVKNKVWATSNENRARKLKNEDLVTFNIGKFNTQMQSWITQDELFLRVLKSLPKNRVFKTTYVKSVQLSEQQKVCDFIGAKFISDDFKGLVKQNDDVILNRFANPNNVKDFCIKIGKGHWLEPELND